MTQTIAELVAALGSENELARIRALGRLMTRVGDDPQAARRVRAVVSLVECRGRWWKAHDHLRCVA